MKNTQKIYFVADEWTDNKDQYQKAQITLIVRDDEKVPYMGAGSLARLSYQRGIEENTGKHGRFYAETLFDVDPSTTDLLSLSAIFTKMSKYSDKIYSKGLSLNVYPIGDGYQQRIALLKAIGATRLYYDRSTGMNEYSLSPVMA